MPKIQSISAKLRQYVEEFSSTVFKTDGKTLFCNICDQAVSSNKRFQVTQHLSTAKYLSNSTRKEKMKQIFIKNSFKDQNSEFSLDLCRAFLASDIPLWKLHNTTFNTFLQKYTGKHIPDQSTIRKKCVSVLYNEVIDRIRKEIGEGPIYVSIDETTDVEGRYVANVVVGLMHGDKCSKSYLLTCEELSKCNYQTVGKLFHDALNILWPNDIKYNKVFLFLTDAAPYMVKTANTLTVLFPNMIHVTCVAHGLHRVCETIRLEYPNIDNMISCVKKGFLKAPSRVLKFRELFPELLLPPQPILTRWGTWLEATSYYADNFNSIKSVLLSLDENTAKSIKNAIALFENRTIQNDLAYIKSNFGFITQSILKLENASLLLDENLEIVENTISKLGQNKGPIAEKIDKKYKNVLEKNTGLKAMSTIHNILNGNNVDEDFPNLTPGEVTKFRYAKITSCDVERSFSKYKNILRSNRRSFIFENLKHHVVVSCNSFE